MTGIFKSNKDRKQYETNSISLRAFINNIFLSAGKNGSVAKHFCEYFN